MAKRIGLLTAGSDCPGLNAAIRAIGKAGQGSYGMKFIGFLDGFQGLIEDRSIEIESSALSGILTKGGTMLGTSREYLGITPSDEGEPGLEEQGLMDEGLVDQAVSHYRKHKLDALVCIGGRETQESAFHLMQQGLKVISLPKAIDNDVAMTDRAIGFGTALEVATQSIDRLHSTAHSHHRIIIVEVMGRHAGWLALGSGITGGADVILIPEIPYSIDKIAQAIEHRKKAGKHFSIVAVSERVVSQEQIAFAQRLRQMNASLRGGADRQRVEAELERIEEHSTDTTFQVSNQLKVATGLDTRITILGYLLRGGSPSADDRMLATQFGTTCVDLLQAGHFGVMTAVREDKVQAIPLDQVIGKHKTVPSDHPWVESARRLETNLGD